MTNKQLQVLCLFVFTIGIVVNDIKCQTREDCLVEMFHTSNMILELKHDQKYMLIKYVLDEVDYDNIIDLLYPPDALLLAGRSEDDAIYGEIKANEKLIQQYISMTTDIEIGKNCEGINTYNTEVLIRRNLLNSIFLEILYEKMSYVQMCVEGEKYKCKLVGLIKRTVEYRMRNEAKCNEIDVSCIITPTYWLATIDSIEVARTPMELYKDYRHDYRFEIPEMIPYYETFLYHNEQGFIPWEYNVPPIKESDEGSTKESEEGSTEGSQEGSIEGSQEGSIE